MGLQLRRRLISPPQATGVNVLLAGAVRRWRGAAVDDFDQEVARTRRNEKLMALLDTRAKQTETVTLDEVKRQLGFGA
jgi:hypothetical protein